MNETPAIDKLKNENAELRSLLAEANDAIDAIRTGQIDALIVNDAEGQRLYTLKSADQTYRVFIEKMREGAVTLSPDGMILYCNSSFAAMLGFSLTDVLGGSFENFVDDSNKSLFNHLFKSSWSADTKEELWLLTKTRKLLPVLLSLTTLKLDDGVALSIIVTDLSIQKNAERQLQLKNEELLQARDALANLNNDLERKVEERTKELLFSREQFKFLADNIPVMVWIARPDGNLDYFNNKWYQYTGLTYEESANSGWQKALLQEDKEAAIASWMHSVETGEDYESEFRLLRASDGLYRWHIATALPFKNDAGEITQWFGINADIEPQKADLARKDEFIGMASHELKTPVTILKAFAQMLYFTIEHDNNPKAIEFVGNIEKQVKRLNKLIDDLLDASRANLREISLEKVNFDFNEMVTEVCSHIQLTAKTHHIKVILGESVQIYGDRNRLGQVVSNLVTNGIKYSPGADKIIVTSCYYEGEIQICVEDFGIGVPLNEQSKLFKRFFRANEVKTNTFPGLGLGLYISNEIIKGHNGHLSFKSEVGKGSLFCMHLPYEVKKY